MEDFDAVDLVFGDSQTKSGAVKPGSAPSDFDAVDLVFGGGSGAKPGPAQRPLDPNAEPDAASWVGRRVQDFRGKRDPRYNDAPVFSGRDVFATAEGNTALLAGAQDADFADIVRKQLGKDHIRSFKDANGFDLVEYRGKDGQPKTEYINKPGLDMADVGRTAIGMLPYAPVAAGISAATRGLPLIAATAQGAGAAGTNLAAQTARQAAGSDQGFDPAEAAFTGLAGAAAPLAGMAIGSAIQRFVTIPGLVNSTGQLTQKGLEVARRNGLNPDDLTPALAKEFSKRVAMTGDEAAAAATVTTKPFGIPVTKGQQTKDPYLLTQEEAMRRRIFGEQAQGTMREFDATQQTAIRDAALGGSSGQRAVAPVLNPGRAPGVQPNDGLPGTLGTGVRTGLQTAREAAEAGENAAWEAVPKIRATQGAIDLLPRQVQSALGDRIVHDGTPAAARMGKMLDDYMNGAAPAQQAAIFGKKSGVPDIDTVRRQLLSLSKGAATPEDQGAARAIYGGFNDWIDAAAEKALLSNDTAAVAALRAARGYTREMREVFAASSRGGSPGAKRLAKALEESDSAEGVITGLLGSGGKTGQAGTVEAVRLMKSALNRYAPDVAGQTLDDLRLALWMRQVTGKNGEMLGPQAIVSNVKTLLTQQQSLVKELMTPGQIAAIRNYAKAVETAAYKPPNASGSGYTAVSLSQTIFGRYLGAVLDKLGANTPLVKAATDLSGLANASGNQAARRAIDQSVGATTTNPTVTPALAPLGEPLRDWWMDGNQNQSTSRAPQ
jgi:hypothetical protein